MKKILFYSLFVLISFTVNAQGYRLLTTIKDSVEIAKKIDSLKNGKVDKGGFAQKSVLFRGATGISEDNSKLYYDSSLSKLHAFKTFARDSAKFVHAVIPGGLITATDSIGAAIGTDSLFWYDDSWGAGSGISAGGIGYSTQVANNLKTTLVNRSIPGTSIEFKQAGDSSLFERIYTLPVYRSTYRAIVLGYIINEARTNGNDPAYNAAKFATQYRQILDTLLIARGWPSYKIVVLAKGLFSTASKTFMKPWVDTAQAVASSKGTQFIDLFHYMMNNGDVALTSTDSLHPNNAGHSALAQAVIYRMAGSGAAKINGTLTVNGDLVLGAKSTLKNNTLSFGTYLNTGGGVTNSLYLIDAGTTAYRAGMAYNQNTGSSYVFGRPTFNTLFGQGDPTTLTTTNSAFYIDGTNNVHINHLLDSIVFPLGGGAQTKIVLNNGTSSTTKAGISYLSTGQMGIYNGNWDMYFATKNDQTTLSPTTAAMYIDGASNNLHLNRMNGAITWASQAGYNTILFAEGGTAATRAGLSWNGAGQLGLLGVFNKGFPIGFKADGADGSTLTTANAAYYIDATNRNYFNTQTTFNGKVLLASTYTAAGTTGAQTINSPSGTVNMAAGATSLTVTNNFANGNSLVYCVIRTNDANKPSISSVVPIINQFTINLTTAPAGEISIGFVVFNY